MDILKEYEKFVEQGRDMREYRDLGVHIVTHILNHVGMLRYDKSKMKDFDLNNSDVGILSDSGISILEGINGEVTDDVLKRNIRDTLEMVDMLESGLGERSVTESLKKSFKNEIRRRVVQEIDYSNLWEL